MLADFHPEMQGDPAIQHLLDVFSRRRADLLDFVSPFTDNNAFLRLSFQVDRGMDLHQFPLLILFERLDQNCRGVGNLLAGQQEYFFPYYLCA